MDYQYRWFYALMTGFLLIVVAFFYLIKPQWNQLSALRATEKKLLEKWNINQPLPTISRLTRPPPTVEITLPARQTEWLTPLLIFIYQQGLLIQSSEWLPSFSINVSNSLVIHLVMQGNFNQLVAFLLALKQQPSSATLLDFSYHAVDQSRIIFTVDLLLFKPPHFSFYPLKNEKIHSSYAHHPFCGADEKLIHKRHHDILQNQLTPLKLIKMTGFLQYEQRKQALVEFPDATVWTVKVGTILGKEQGKVTAIFPHQLVVALPHQQQWLIPLNRKR